MVDGVARELDVAADGLAVADGGDAQADAEPGAGLFAFVLGAVLQGGDGEVAADVGVDLLALELRTGEGGVSPAGDLERVAGFDQGVVVGGFGAVGFAGVLAGGELEADAVLLTKADGDAAAVVVPAVAAVDFRGIGGGFKRDVPRGGEADVGALELEAFGVEIAVSASMHRY